MTDYGKVKESLIKQLEHKQANVEHFKKMIDDYVWFAEQEDKMKKDIEENGTMLPCMSSTGNPIRKENPAVKSAVMYNKQMLAILKQLDLTTDDVGCDEDETL